MKKAPAAPAPAPAWGRIRRILGRARRRARATRARFTRRLRYGPGVDRLPAVFGNSMAKAGSHLLAQYLEGLTTISPLLFLEPAPVRTITAEGKRQTMEWVLRELRALRAGEIRWGYVPSRPEYVRALVSERRVIYFLYRDPRDKVVSHILYALEIHKRHAMHDYYLGLPGMEERIDATIRGVPGLVQNIRATYESYLGWFDEPGVLAISYEQLMQARQETLRRLLAPIREAGVDLAVGEAAALEALDKAMSPVRSPTYRSGQPGNWETYFTAANKRAFKEVTGDLLVRLGYEGGADW